MKIERVIIITGDDFMTAHIEAKKEDIADIVIMPGDPLRAKWIADTYLKDAKLVNQIRNMYAYTGYYHDKKITVMASGMGMPSIGIYSYELYHFYDVKTIIRVGTAGSYSKDFNVYDMILVNNSYSDSSYAKVQNNIETNILEATDSINSCILKTAKEQNMLLRTADIYSSDVFYKEQDNFEEILEKYGCVACEMESFALFHNAKVANRNAACLLTVSNSFVTLEETTAEERQHCFSKMIELALEASLNI